MPRSFALFAAFVVFAVTLPLRGDEPAAKKASAAEGSDPATMFLGLDANKDGQLTGDEVPAAQKRLFERLLRTADKDGDGKLSSSEFVAGIQGPADKPQKSDEARRPDRPGGKEGDDRPKPGKLFKRMDANGDGKVALDEVPEERRDRFQKLLARGDKDGDGALTREEFVQALPDGDGKPEKPSADKSNSEKPNTEKSNNEKRPEGRPDPQQFFRRLDANGDGKVVLDEVPERLRPRIEQLINRADKDGDKALSLEEFAAVGPPGRPPEGRPGQPRPDQPRPDRRPPGDRGFPPAGLFRALDADRDGKLSATEITAAAEVIRKLDKDGDGSVTIEELVAAGPGGPEK